MGRRVIVLSRLYPSSADPGAGPFVRDQVLELARRNRLTVVSPLQPRGRRQRALVEGLPFETEEHGLRVVRPRFVRHIPVGGRAIGPWLWALRLRPVLQQESLRLGGAELVHAHFALPEGFAAAYFAARETLPFILTVWGSDILVHGRELVSRRFVAEAVRRARVVVAVSEQLAERVVDLGAQPSRVRVIVGGVPYRDRIDRAAARESVGVDEASTLILWVGRLVPVKQPVEAVAAFAELAMPDALLVMAGGGPLRKDVLEFAQRRGVGDRVRILGQLDREAVWRWQCAADLLVNSSRSEGTPFAVLETLGAGTPVSAYPLPGVSKALGAVGGGMVAEVATPSALAAAMRATLRTGSQRDGVSAAARMQFSLARVTQAINEAYDEVVG